MTRSGRIAAPRSEDGFATVWTAGAALALLAVFATLMWLGAAAHARHRAAASADLAALGAAARLVEGKDRACATAEVVTRRMGAELRSCRSRGWDVLITVRVRAGLPLGDIGGTGAATGRARAGPVTTVR